MSFASSGPASSICARYAASAIGALSFLAALGGMVRIAPLVLRSQAALATVWPFARSVGYLALEASVLSGWSLGFVLAFAQMLDRGELRAYASLGVSPLGLLRRVSPPALLLTLILAWVGHRAGEDAHLPGLIVREHVQSAKAHCAARPEVAVEPVPLLAAAFVCVPGQAPRLVGQAPGQGWSYAAEQWDISDDLRVLRLQEVELTRAWSGFPVHVHARAIELRGLPTFLIPKLHPPLYRGLAIALAGLVSAFTAALWLLRIGRVASARPLPWLVALGLAGPLTALATSRGEALWHLLVSPVAAFIAICIIGVVWQSVATRHRQ
jgi:hypothetical protein